MAHAWQVGCLANRKPIYRLRLGLRGGTTDNKTTSASTGLAGYDYQDDVSIYLALDLMLMRKRVNVIILECANHEGLVADLKGETQISTATRITIGG